MDTLLENDGSRGTKPRGTSDVILDNGFSHSVHDMDQCGLSSYGRSYLQHQQIIGMLNTMYATQTGHGAIMENVQIDLIDIRARLGIPQTH